ncbi:MAG: DUF2075 domain-containing protein [Alphaproteobacteria bacterium]|nr:MAG: DUF2075 domain-containing protein [Alphaproteobacteria bacterium]
MYAEFYKLSGRPFQLTPDPRFYFDSATHKKAMAYLTYGLAQGEGFIIITGDIGAGKTTLVGHLFDELDREQYVAAKVVTTQLGADDLLRLVASGFGISTEGADKALLLQRIHRFLVNRYHEGKRALLIVDEAQNLPTAALEELRMLSNFQEGDHALLQSFLLGQPEFREKWAHDPDLEQLRQRVIATHHLEPMNREETEGYIKHRLELVGWKGDPEFTKDAFDRIHDYADGVPRRLNTLMSRVLLLGAIEELHKITGETVEEVIDDLERDNRATAKSRADAARTGAELQAIKGAMEEAQAGYKANGTRLDDTTLSEILRRLDVLEEYVRMHDETIKQALDLASRWFEECGGADE